MPLINCFDVRSGQWCAVDLPQEPPLPLINVQSDDVSNFSCANMNNMNAQAYQCNDILIKIVLRPGERLFSDQIPIWIQTNPGTQFVEATCQSVVNNHFNPNTTDLLHQSYCKCSAFQCCTQTVNQSQTECETSIEMSSNTSTATCSESEQIDFNHDLKAFSSSNESQLNSEPSLSSGTLADHSQSTITSLNQTVIKDENSENSPSDNRKVANKKSRCSFVSKLYEVVQKGYWTCVKWNDAGTGILFNMSKLESEIKHRPICRTRQLASFIRQLHLYGFRRNFRFEKENHFDHCYMNPYFQKNNPVLLSKLKPRKKSKRLIKKEPQENTDNLNWSQDSSSSNILSETDNNLQNILNSNVSPSKFCKIEPDLLYC